MSRQVLAPGTQPCVWMTAGVLRYRLCARNMDCESCPLDRALRGDPTATSLAVAGPPTAPGGAVFPDDRRYTSGHLWVQALGENGRRGRVWRLGLDVIAAAVVGVPRDIQWVPPTPEAAKGDPLCVLDLGMGNLTVGAPVPGRVLRFNDALRLFPDRAVAAPYGAGWLLEFSPTDPGEIQRLLGADSALAGAGIDLRRFRAAVARSVLGEAEDPARCNGDVPQPDLRCLLGGSHYVELLRTLVH